MKRSLRSWLWRVPLDQEVDDELALHVELRTRELVERGLDPGTARDIVLSRIGDLGHLKRTCIDLGRKRDREMRIVQWLDERKTDVKFALRQLKASPAFTMVAAITLALGIGANSAMFALADATLIRPLPYPQSDRLVMIWMRPPTFPRSGVSPMDLHDWEEQNHTFEALGGIAFGAGGGPLLEGPDGSLRSTDHQTVTPRFFDVLGVVPVAGRTFQPSDGQQGAPRAIVMAEGVWRTRFSADPALIGRQVRLNGDPVTVIGVVRDDVQMQRPAQIWSLLPPLKLPRHARFFQAIGRVKPGVSLDAAQADLAVIADRLAQAYPETNKDWGVFVEPLRTGVMSSALQNTSLLLIGVVAFVLLLCCANVANLLLARGSARARELAVRSALGAGRSRIVSQVLTESLVLATAGGVLGAAIGAFILRIAPTFVPAGLLPAALTVGFDGRVAVFTAAAALAVGVLFGLVPAWQATRTPLPQAISSEGRSSTRRGGRLRNVLVGGEVAAAVVLLCGAGLLLRTLLVLDSFDPGYRAGSDSVLTLDFSLEALRPGSRYPDMPSVLRFYDEATREVSAIPGVRTIGWSTGLPYGTTTEIGRVPVEIVGDPPLAPNDRPIADFQAASPGYFDTLDLPIVAGRGFTDGDTSNSPQICLVNEAFVRRYLGSRNPIGMRVRAAAMRGLDSVDFEREVVGVVRQMKDRLDVQEAPAQMFVPLAQFPWPETYLAVQASTGPVLALLAPIRDAIARIDRDVPVRRERTLTDLANLTTAPHRFRAVLVGTFAVLALALAMVGIFGVLAYSVQQRSRELGVRIALGATGARVLRLILGGAARVVAIGGVIGLAAAAVLMRTISSFLSGVQPIDPMTFGSVSLILALTAAVATAAPAWRATRVDPVEVFRAE